MAKTAEAIERSATPIRVFLIDEEVVVRAGMRILIDSWLTAKVVGEADVVTQAMAVIEVIKPDLIVFSHTGRSTESLEALGELIKIAGQAPLVLLTSSRDPKVSAVAANAGAKWIMLKQEAAGELRTAIEKAYSGEVWVSKRSGQSRFAQDNHERQVKPDLKGALTNREREVALLVSRGCTNRQVGVRLGITEVTVRHHLSSIFNKLAVANRFELIACLYRFGLVTPVMSDIS